jgi:hypothetical protein
LRGCSVDGERGRGGGEGSDVDVGDVEGWDSEFCNSEADDGSPGRGVGRMLARNESPARGRSPPARVPSAERVAGALGGLGLDLAHGFFQRQPLAGDL